MRISEKSEQMKNEIFYKLSIFFFWLDPPYEKDQNVEK